MLLPKRFKGLCVLCPILKGERGRTGRAAGFCACAFSVCFHKGKPPGLNCGPRGRETQPQKRAGTRIRVKESLQLVCLVYFVDFYCRGCLRRAEQAGFKRARG